MNELIKFIKDFIVRDIIYIIGGVSVILSLLYAFGKMDVIGKEPSIITVLYIIGISYVVGWVIQETFSLIHVVTLSMSYRPWSWWVITLLYRLYIREKYQEIPQFDQDKYSVKINEKANQRNIAESDRIVNHLQICTTIGPCAFVTGIILWVFRFDCIRQLFPEGNTASLPKGFDICIIVLSIILMIFSRTMIIRLTIFTYKLNDYLTKHPKEPKDCA